jgi:lipoprotein-anchoring transpeptidase ErfK/SrfK
LPRRRSFLFGGLALALAAAVAASAWKPPSATSTVLDLATSRRVAGDALRALRIDSPGSARLLDRLVADAEAVTAQETTAPAWRRTPGRLEAAWRRVFLAARGALQAQHARTRTYEERWAELRENAAAEVARATDESGEAGMGRREIAATRQATLKWALAEQYAAGGELERAIPEAEEARRFADVVHQSFVDLHSRFRDPKNLRIWRDMVRETVAETRGGGTAIVVDKLDRRLYLYTSGRRVGVYRVEIGAKGLKQKMHSGDQATPEGRYRVQQVRGQGRTRYYKALLIDYPNGADRARFSWGRRTGQVPSNAGIGSLIEIHGEGGQGRDWTDGCVALSNPDMDRVFARAQVGTPVTIVGTF